MKLRLELKKKVFQRSDKKSSKINVASLDGISSYARLSASMMKNDRFFLSFFWTRFLTIEIISWSNRDIRFTEIT